MGNRTITTEPSENGAITFPRTNVSGYIGHATIFSGMYTIVCCIVEGLGSRLDLAFGWLVAMQAYFLLVSIVTHHTDDCRSDIASN